MERKRKITVNFKNMEKTSNCGGSNQPRVKYLKYLINYSKIIHMWPQEKPSLLQSLVHHIIVWTIFISTSIFILCLLYKITVDYKNVDEIAEIIDFVTVSISATFRYMYIYFRGKKYLEIISVLHNNFIYYSLFPSKKRSSIEKYEKNAKRLVFAYTLFVLCLVLQLIFMPLIKHTQTTSSFYNQLNNTKLEKEYPLPKEIYLPFDISHVSWHIALYVLQAVLMIIWGMIYMIVDSFWVTIIVLTIGQLDLIKASIDTLMEETSNYDTETRVETLNKYEMEHVETRLIKCVQHHDFVKRFVRFIEEMFSPNVLVNALHSVISITFILLEMVVVIKNKAWHKYPNLITFLSISVIHMFVYDWLGNELLVKEEEVRLAIYNLPWYKYPSQKLKIILVLILSGHCVKLTGGKIYKLTLEFFIKTMKIVFSYFSFMLQVRDKNSS